jgi:hypothetical protein
MDFTIDVSTDNVKLFTTVPDLGFNSSYTYLSIDILILTTYYLCRGLTPYYFSPNNFCCDICPDRYYNDMITFNCGKCPYDCLTCNDTGHGECLSCNLSDYRKFNTTTKRCDPF